MTMQPVTPRHVQQGKEAEIIGHRAGYNWRLLRSNLDMPRTEWKCLLEQIQINPWAPGEYHESECSHEEAERLAKRWDEGFVLGDHAAQGEARRGSA